MNSAAHLFLSDLPPTVYASPEANPAAVFLAGLAPGSRPAMRQALEVIASVIAHGLTAANLPWHLLRYTHTAAIRSALAGRYMAATTNRMLAALRGVLREAWRLGLVDVEAYHRAADLRNVRSYTLPAGRVLSPGELATLFATCRQDESPAGRRDGALMALLYAAGLRRSEVVSLDVADYDASASELIVRGKGNRQRAVPVTQDTADFLAGWLEARGTGPGPLLVPVNRGGRLLNRRMSPQAILAAVGKRAGQARLSHTTPHDMRRSFATNMLDRGADVFTVQQLMGHASSQTTARYDRRDQQTKRRAVQLLHVPL